MPYKYQIYVVKLMFFIYTS